jgi:hypothetical protein
MSVAALLLFACGSPAAVAPSEAPSATIAPLTPTGTASPLPPTATPTLAPAPRTFTEGFDAGASYWQFLQAGASADSVAPRAQSSTLRFDLPGPDLWAYALYAGPVYDDVRIDAVVDFGAGVGASAGLICRYDAGRGWYEFNIHPDGAYTILFGQWLEEGIARYAPLVVSESDTISPTVNEIGLVCEGDILTPFVNSVQLRRRQEALHVLTEGQVGVSAASSGAGRPTIAFDWISVGDP